MAQRDNRHSFGYFCTTPRGGPTVRCPVQSSTPLGPDQVNVLLLLFCFWMKWPTGTSTPLESSPDARGSWLIVREISNEGAEYQFWPKGYDEPTC
jgi:hypothetical protein